MLTIFMTAIAVLALLFVMMGVKIVRQGYRYTIISGSVEEDLQKFRAIMRAERYLSHRMVLST